MVIQLFGELNCLFWSKLFIMKQSTCAVSRWQLLKSQLNNLSPEEFARMADEHPEAVVVDVRTPGEYAGGTVLGAQNMDYLGENFWDQFEQLPDDRPILVLCRTGRRSARVCTLLKNTGLTDVYNLEDGLAAWETSPESV